MKLILHIHRLLPVILLGLLLSPPDTRAQDASAKLNAMFNRVYGASIDVSKEVAVLDDAQLASVRSASGYGYGSKVQFFTITSGGRRLGYCIVDEVRGKSKLITYALVVDKDLTVKDLEVLAYREPYGGEIQYEAFRRQFRGKGTRDPLRVGVDIRNISGATISSNSVTNGVRKLLAVLKELKNAGKLH